MTVSIILALAIALAPACYAWFTGRRLLRLKDDPLFPERLHARQQRSGQVLVGSMVVLPFVAPGHWWWSLPLLFSALLIAAFPFRRAVLDETWSLFAYLRYCVLDFVGGLGVVLLSGLSPVIVLVIVQGWMPDRTRQLPLALGLGVFFAAGLLLWQRYYPRVWLRLHGASPIDGLARGAELRARFDAIMDRAGAALDRRPSIHRYGVPGGHIVNAVALPSLAVPAVALSDTLLERLELDESTAVFAHEIAHHEHYNTKRLRGLRRRSYLGVVMVAILPAALTMLPFDGIASIVAWVYPLVVTIGLGQRLKKNQAHETESDLRAVALTGDPGAVARALTKIHFYSRTPRRWAQDFERAASHPSLARRLQAIHAQGAEAIAAFGAPKVLRSATPGSYVALDDTRAYWFAGVPEGTPLDVNALRNGASSYRAVAYADLTELRIAADDAQRVLRATDQSGQSWSIPLHESDVPAVQTALDVVDVRLGTVETKDSRATASTARWVAVTLLLVMVMTGGSSLALVPTLISTFAPTAASVAAMAAMALGRVLVTVGGGDVSVDFPLQLFGLIVMAMFGGESAWLTWKWLRQRTPLTTTSWLRRSTFTITVLAVIAGVLAIVSAPGMVNDPTSVLGDASSASLAIVLLGLGAALFTLQRPRWRMTGASVAVIALTGAGLAVFGDRVFGSGSSDITWRDGQLTAVQRVPLGGTATQLGLSPSGATFVVRRTGGYDDDDEGERAVRFVVGTLSQPVRQRTVNALRALLVDDERVLLLAARGPDSLELRLERAVPVDSTVFWRVAFPALAGQRLTMDRVGGKWTVSGRAMTDSAALVSITGTIADGAFAVKAQPADSLNGTTLFAFSDGATLFTAFNMPGAEARASTPAGLLPLLTAWGVNGMRWQLWRVGRDGRRRIGAVKGFLVCGDEEVDGAVLCADQSRKGVQLWRLSSTGEMSEISRMSRSVDRVHVSAGGKVALSPYTGNSVTLLDATTRVAMRASLPRASAEFPGEIVWAPGGAVALTYGQGGTKLVVYRLSQ